jgi:hypothetical protein
MKKWVGIFLNDWFLESGILAETFPSLSDFIGALQRSGFDIRIVSAIRSDAEEVREVAVWLEKHGAAACLVTDAVDSACQLIIGPAVFGLDQEGKRMCAGCQRFTLDQLKGAGLAGWPTARGSFMELM